MDAMYPGTNSQGLSVKFDSELPTLVSRLVTPILVISIIISRFTGCQIDGFLDVG